MDILEDFKRNELNANDMLREHWLNWLPPQEYDDIQITKCFELWTGYIKHKQKIFICYSPKQLANELNSHIFRSLKYFGDYTWNDFRYYCRSFHKLSYVAREEATKYRCFNLSETLTNSLSRQLNDGLSVSSEITIRENLYGCLEFITANLHYLFHQKEFGLKRTLLNMGKYAINSLDFGFGIAFVTEIFAYIIPIPKYHLNSNDVVHKDLAPALIWPDGSKEYFLNGVKVPEPIAMTIGEKLPAMNLLTEKNAEVRREIVKKIGIERVCKELKANCIDKKDNYELLELAIDVNRHRPYLKMINPSTGTYHIEGVKPGIRTVEQALNWRNQSDEKPEVLT